MFNNKVNKVLLVLVVVVVGLVVLSKLNLLPVNIPFLKHDNKAEAFKAYSSKAECIRALGDADACADY